MVPNEPSTNGLQLGSNTAEALLFQRVSSPIHYLVLEDNEQEREEMNFKKLGTNSTDYLL